MLLSNNQKTDILIIGAGKAALMAADKLQEAAHQVEILEARNRLGGRIWSNRIDENPIELGAEFINGRPEEIFF